MQQRKRRSGGAALPMLELAVLLAGFVLVPLDAEEPVPRLQLVLEAQPSLLVCSLRVPDRSGRRPRSRRMPGRSLPWWWLELNLRQVSSSSRTVLGIQRDREAGPCTSELPEAASS